MAFTFFFRRPALVRRLVSYFLLVMAERIWRAGHDDLGLDPC
jgi:hypothetical protein